MLLWTLRCMYLFKLVFLFFSDMYPRVELLHHTVVLVLVFWEASVLFPTMAALNTLPPAVYKDSVFFKSLPILVICVLSDDSHSGRCDVISLVHLICFSLIIVEHMKTIFSCACWPSVCFLWKNSIQVFCPVFNQVWYFFYVDLYEMFMYFGY